MIPNAESLASTARAVGKRGPAPVHLWNPPHCGDLDMVIKRDGTWHYLGTPIGRPALVKLFANILRKDGADYVLVTPVEKVGITVEDAPFVATDFHVSGQGREQSLTFVTNIGDEATAGPVHALRVERDPVTGTPSPYIHIRANLEALIDRKSFYRLVDACETTQQDGTRWFGLWSGGVFFPLIPEDDLTSE